MNREHFHAYCDSKNIDRCLVNGDYRSLSTQDLWSLWQAALASTTAAQPVQEPAAAEPVAWDYTPTGGDLGTMEDVRRSLQTSPLTVKAISATEGDGTVLAETHIMQDGEVWKLELDDALIDYELYKVDDGDKQWIAHIHKDYARKLMLLLEQVGQPGKEKQ